MKGNRINRLWQLGIAAHLKKMVVVPCNRKMRKPCPAVFVWHMTAAKVAEYLAQGMFLWEPKRKSEPPWEKSNVED